MKKRGFTLIELLAVIVVLAVIALIAVPIVLNLIEKSKEGAFKDSAYAVSKAAGNYYVVNYEDKDKITNKILDITELDYTGNVKEGTIVFNQDGNYAFIIMQDEYCAYKYATSSEIFLGNVISSTCVVDDIPISMDDLITANIVEEAKKTNIVIGTDGVISYTEGSSKSEYIVSSDGVITKDGVEIIDSTERDNTYSTLMTAILSDTTATSMLVQNQTLIDGFKNNEAAMNVMLDGLVDYFNAQYSAETIKSSMAVIEDNISNLVGGTATITEGTSTADKVSKYISTLKNVTNYADIIITNFNSILNVDAFTKALVKLSNADEVLFKNSEVLNKLFSNATVFQIMANNTVLMSKIADTQESRTAMYNNYKVTQSILASSTVALNVMSSRAVTYSIEGTSSVSKVVYSGKGFVLNMSFNSSETASLGNFTDGSAKETLKGKTLGSVTTKSINKFVSTLYLGHNKSNGTRIVTAKLFKI